MSAPTTIPSRAWVMLGLGVAAQAAGTVVVSTPAFLIPLLHTERGIGLAHAGLLAATPTVGMVMTLVLWGALADRIGERWVIAGGLALTSLATTGAILAHGYLLLGVCFLLAGMSAASTNAASGRVVVGWFPRERRGFAMGIRQIAQPLGVTIAAVLVPTLASHGGVGTALIAPLVATVSLAVACALGIADPPRSRRVDTDVAPDTNPYRASAFLLRIHVVSMLLVVPQFTLSTFGLVWLITQLHVAQLTAGILIGAAQFVGALGRIAVGMLSDRVDSRVRPLRWVAISACTAMLVLAAMDTVPAALAAAALIVATTITVADNGLAYTAVAEMAGSAWAGRALGIQNSGQFVAASAVGPAIGGLIALVGYPLAFAATALFPALAMPLIPHQAAERDRL